MNMPSASKKRVAHEAPSVALVEKQSKKTKTTKGRGGPRPNSGRKKGSPNKITRDVKEAILSAFSEVGGADYLVKLAKEDQRTFCALLGKILPTTVGGDPNNPIELQIKRIELVVVDPKS